MATELHRKDQINQSLFPTVMVPKMSGLQPCEVGQVRFLMADDGLYLETKQEWGRLVKKVWDCPRDCLLPYGHVEEHDDFREILNKHIMPIVAEVMIPEAAGFAKEQKEWAGLVIWNGSEFIPCSEEISVTGGRAEFMTHAAADMKLGSIVGDVHSHHTMVPYFSGKDDFADRGRVKISVVLGNYREEDGKHYFDWKARYCVQGFFFDCEETAESDEELIEELGL